MTKAELETLRLGLEAWLSQDDNADPGRAGRFERAFQAVSQMLE
jgi:hypothetical protein